MSTTNRRSFLRLVLLGSGSALMAACAAPTTPSPTAAPAQKAAAPTTAPAAPASGAAPPPTAAAVAAAKPANVVDQLYEGAKKEGKVVWWDQHELRVAQTFMDGFKKTYPGIEFEYLEGNLDELRPKAIAETRAGRVSLDFIDTGQSYEAYKEAKLLTNNADLLVAAGVPMEQQYEGTYTPEWTVYLASYNPNLVKSEELPKTWNDFLDPKWKGKLGLEGTFAAVCLWHTVHGRRRGRGGVHEKAQRADSTYGDREHGYRHTAGCGRVSHCHRHLLAQPGQVQTQGPAMGVHSTARGVYEPAGAGLHSSCTGAASERGTTLHALVCRSRRRGADG